MRDDRDLLQDQREVERREELAADDAAEEDDAEQQHDERDRGRIGVQEVLRSANEARPLFLEARRPAERPAAPSRSRRPPTRPVVSLFMPLLVPMPMQDREGDRFRVALPIGP